MTAMGTLRLLEMLGDLSKPFAFPRSSSELFGRPLISQDEQTPIAPVTPYGWRQGLRHPMVT